MASRTAIGGGIAPAGLDGRASFAESEPKLGAYAPGSTWMGPNRPKSNKRKWVVRIFPLSPFFFFCFFLFFAPCGSEYSWND